MYSLSTLFKSLILENKIDQEIPVGRHNHIPDSEFDYVQLESGITTEYEHTNDPLIAKAIAKDHLAEICDYYTRLAKMEAEAKTELENE